MLTIRPEQKQVFDVIHQERFVDRSLDLLKKNFPEQLAAIPEAQRRPMVREGMVISAQHGIEVENDVFGVVLLNVLLGQGFLIAPEYQWIEGLLSDRRLAPGTRLLQIRTRLRAQA